MEAWCFNTFFILSMLRYIRLKKTKGGNAMMMDIIMGAVLAIGFLLMKLFVDWNDKQINKK